MHRGYTPCTLCGTFEDRSKWGFRELQVYVLNRLRPGLLPREMASDMMEAMFLGDPGYFLSLNDGVKYFIWRRTVLKLQGKHPLTGRLFPHFPVFNFDFRSPFLLRDPRTNKQYTVTSQVIRQTYAYFYSCWRRNAFPSSQDETPNNGQEPNNFNQQPDKPNGQSFHMFLLHSKFWDQFGPVVAENSVQGARLRNDVIHNLITHLDIAFQGVRSHKIKDKDDALAYIEASAEFWSDPNWRHPEGYIPTPDYHRIVVHVQQIPLVYPYAISVDFHVREREPRFKPAHVQSPPKEYITIVEHEDCVRPVTAEEAEFLDQFISYDAELNVDKDVEMEEEARHDTPSVVMTDLDMGLEPMVFML